MELDPAETSQQLQSSHQSSSLVVEITQNQLSAGSVQQSPLIGNLGNQMKTQSSFGLNKKSQDGAFINKFYDKTFAQAFEGHIQYEIHNKKLQDVKEEIKKLKQTKKEENNTRISQIEKVKLIKNQSHSFRQNERVNEILKHNQLLLEKLYDIQIQKKQLKQSPTNAEEKNAKKNSLHYNFKKQQAEQIDQENLRIMYKIVNIESSIRKKKMDDQYKEYRKLKKNLSKLPQYDIDKLVENTKKTFQHVESKTSNFLPAIVVKHQRSQSTVEKKKRDDKDIEVKSKKFKLSQKPSPSHSQSPEEALDEDDNNFEFQKEIVDKVLAEKRIKKTQKQNKKLLNTHETSIRHPVILPLLILLIQSPNTLSLQQQIFTARVKNQILRDRKSLHKSLAETWIDSINYPRNQQKQKEGSKSPARQKKKKNKSKVFMIHQKSLEIFQEIDSDKDKKSNNETLNNTQLDDLQENSQTLSQQQQELQQHQEQSEQKD